MLETPDGLAEVDHRPPSGSERARIACWMSLISLRTTLALLNDAASVPRPIVSSKAGDGTHSFAHSSILS